MADNAGNLCFNCYGPSTVKFATASGDTIIVEQQTEYPFREDIKFVVHMDKPSYMKFILRIPGWCKGAEYSINGVKSSSPKCQAGYFEIERTWKDGDAIDLHLPMEVIAVDVDDSDFCMRFPVAIERGPLLFAYRLPEKWTVTAPVELNPHPDWPCYEINTEISEYYPKGLVLDRKSLESSSAFKVAYRDIGNENPWVKSPVVITVNAGQAEYIYNRRMITTQEQLSTNIVKITGESKEIELVPYGCTNLRISYFPAYNR